MDGIQDQEWSPPWKRNLALGVSIAVGLATIFVFSVLVEVSLTASVPPSDTFPGPFVVVWTFFALLPVLVVTLPTYLFLRYGLVAPVSSLVLAPLYAISSGATDPDTTSFGGSGLFFLLVVLAGGEVSVRALVGGRWRPPISPRSLRAVRVGGLVALIYAVLATVSATVIHPIVAEPPFAPQPPIDYLLQSLGLFLLFFVLYLVGVGLPVGLFVRFRTIVPLIGAVLLVAADIAILWTTSGGPTDGVVVFLLMIPVIGIAVSLLGLVEYLLKRALSER